MLAPQKSVDNSQVCPRMLSLRVDTVPTQSNSFISSQAKPCLTLGGELGRQILDSYSQSSQVLGGACVHLCRLPVTFTRSLNSEGFPESTVLKGLVSSEHGCQDELEHLCFCLCKSKMSLQWVLPFPGPVRCRPPLPRRRCQNTGAN